MMSEEGQERLRHARVHLVTDRRMARGRSLAEAVGQAVYGGVEAVHLRERDLPADVLYALGLELQDVCRGRALLIVNDRVDVALALQADGVQLGERSLPVEVVRKLVGNGVLIGRSVHSCAGATKAEHAGADYLLLGTIFATPSHPGEQASGVELVRRVRGAVRIPIIAIGGIRAENAERVIEAGADGVAVISAVLGASDVYSAAYALRQAVIHGIDS